MTRPAEVAQSPTWIVWVRGRLGACAEHYRTLHPRVEGDRTALEVPSQPGRGLVSALVELQAYGLEVVEIERRGT